MGFIEEQQLESAYVMGTYARKPVELVRGRGMQVEDSEGRTYLDFVSGVGAVSLGHCHPALVSAIEEQASTLVHVSNYYYIEHRGEVAHLVSDLLNECVDEAEREPWQSFFANSGAEANECAFKLARLHAKKRAMAAAEAAGADEDGVRAAAAAAPRLIVTLDASFHGRTLGTLAATGQDVFHRDYQPLPGGFLYAQPGECEALERLAAEHPCAAILFEAVQGEGGVRPIGQEFASCLQEVCRKHDLLLMADEVQLGNGRSGSLYGYMNYGLQPDVVSTAKGIGGGLPLGVTMFGERVADVFHPGDHGTTFGGNPVCCAGAVNILSRIDDRLLEGVRERSDYLRRTLQAAPGIRSVTGMGLMLGLEIDIPAREFAERALREGVLVTTAKQKIRLLPALNIPMELLKTAAQALVHCAIKVRTPTPCAASIP